MILQMSISASILIIIVTVIRLFAINRLPKKMFFLLWSIILARLLIPFSIPIKLGVFDLISKGTNTFDIGQGIISGIMPQVSIKEVTHIGQNIALANQPVNALPVLLICWAIGSMILLLIFIIAYIKSYYRFREALPIESNDIILDWVKEQAIKRRVEILRSDRLTTPITLGIIRPKIIFPKAMNYKSEQELIYVLAHEMVHIKRFDNLWKLMSIIAVCVHWFNPLVWIMYVLFNRDIEITCDEKVISTYGDEMKAAYAFLLIDLTAKKSSFYPLYSSFSKNSLEERVRCIMKFRKMSTKATMISVILVIGASITFTSCAKPTIGVNTIGNLISPDKTEITPEVLKEFNNIGKEYNLRFVPEYNEDGTFDCWDDVLLYLYKSGYSGGAAMKVEDIEVNITNIFGDKASFSHQSTENFALDDGIYTPGGIAYSGTSQYRIEELYYDSGTSLYLAKINQLDSVATKDTFKESRLIDIAFSINSRTNKLILERCKIKKI